MKQSVNGSGQSGKRSLVKREYQNYCLNFFVILGDSRKQFDVFYRALLGGENPDYPKPSKFKLTKHQLFPEKGTVWDWIFTKKNNGSWVAWMELTEKIPTPQNAKVYLFHLYTLK